ncbi:MAG: TetR family transcriptional regulator C-terminal domain-containing protein [Deltaproteobacteria bacterium]|nr:TetR family transcriptional regulator C-terminal domain-containing protein [Deltaproteobacteria bacterium]MBW1817882.1 TetR family transcriptional regulator C-terminal domain-containing protein [Deltaproteobacteria bacterium]
MDAKTRILKAGARIVLQKGFFDTGLAEVLEAAKVPKGSFYFYFKNKEDFGLQLIDFFAAYLKAANDRTYQDESLPHVERIRRAFRERVELFQKRDFKGGCPIGNLALEMGDRSPGFRKKLNQVFADMKQHLAKQLQLARASGEISEAIDVDETADFVLSSFEGALMQMKVAKSLLAHEIFERMIFERLLTQQAV